MVDFRYPGIYTQELSRVAPIQGVSTSNFGVVGMAERGPEDEATLVTSFTQFQEQFGDFISDSQLAMQVYAFFANEGRQAYVVRVCRSDAVAACGFVMNDVADEVVENDGAGGLTCNSAGSGLPGPTSADIVNTPVNPGSVSFTWFESTTQGAVAAQFTAGPAPLIAFSFRLSDGLGVNRERIERGPIPGFLTWNDSGAVLRSVDLLPTGPADDVMTLEETGAPGVVIGYVDAETGWVTINCALFTIPGPGDIGAGNPVASLPFQYGVARTVTDDGAGGLTGDVDPGGTNVIDYDGTGFAGVAGAYGFAYGDGVGPLSPLLGGRVLVAYEQQDFRMCASSRGAWGNDLELRVFGSDEFYSTATGQYTRVDLEIWYDDPIEGTWVNKENFQEIVLDDPTDPNYIVSVLNDTFKGSGLLSFDASQAQDAFTQGVNGRLRSGLPLSWGEAIGGGDGVSTQFEGAGALSTADPIIERTLTIQYYDVIGTLRTITDDGEGNLVGDVAPAGTNTVDYATGALEFTTLYIPEASPPGPPVPNRDGLLKAQYYTDPQCATYCSDTMTGGSDGVAALSRTEVSSPALEATNRGVYALNVPDEMMTVGIPDFADDPTITLDLIAWAQRRMDKFIVAACPYGATPTQAKNYKQLTLASYSSYCALYYPWLGVVDPKTDLETFMPPIGWAAGAYARTDNNKTVSKAPAGVEDGALQLAVSLERNLSLEEIGVLNKAGVNCLYESAETGRVIWGARTLSRDDFLYIQRRRFFMFVEKSVYKSTWNFVFETISTGLFERVKTLVEGFLNGLLSLGYFPTGVPSLAYLVVCDESNNPPSLTEQGIVVCDIWLAPSTPGEFILFRFQQLVVAGT